jgi:hypothetical protein
VGVERNNADKIGDDTNMITYEKAHELFEINENWELVRKVSTGPRAKVGDVAGTIKDGYRRVNVYGELYLAHRLIWLMVHGKFPVDMLDHINGNGLDNHISNLREATNQQNMQNQTKPQSGNKSGFLGVSLHKKGRFRADLSIDGKTIYIGLFDTPEEAHQVYLQAKRKHHEFCTI